MPLSDAPRPPYPPLPHWETHARRPAAPRSGRSRPRCGPGSPPPAARSRRSSPSSRSGSRAEVDEIEAARRRGETVWPVIDYADIAAGTVSARAARRCCAAAAASSSAATSTASRRWAGTADIVDYVEGNRLLRELPRPRRRLLRQRRLQARDLPDLLVAGADAGPPERPDGRACRRSSTPVEARVRGRAVVRPGPRLALPRPHPPPARGRRLGRARHATSTRAPSTCG